MNWSVVIFELPSIAMASRIPETSNDDDDLTHVEEIEQLCNQMSRYEPCFRTSLIQYHLKRQGIASNDERLVKLISLSFETMVNLLSTTRTNLDNYCYIRFVLY
jgi:hypothetical protein